MELNGVSVTFNSAVVRVQKRNRFAKTISYYAVHVPSGSEDMMDVPIGPVTVCGGSAVVSIGVDQGRLGLSDYLLGAKVSRSVCRY